MIIISFFTKSSTPVYLFSVPFHRNVLLEILNRLPNNDVLKAYVPELLQLSMEVGVHVDGNIFSILSHADTGACD